jgi:hypothetical protein
MNFCPNCAIKCLKQGANFCFNCGDKLVNYRMDSGATDTINQNKEIETNKGEDDLSTLIIERANNIELMFNEMISREIKRGRNGLFELHK